MSTFGGLSTAYTGLAAARAGIDTIGQNMANVNTEGYTRQRVSQSANGSLAGIGPLDTLFRGGTGVTVDMIQRLGDALLEGRVRTSSASSGYASMTSTVQDALETALNEPGNNGIASSLANFWSSWQNMSRHPGDASAAGVVLEAASKLSGKIAQGYQDAVDTFSTTRSQAAGMVVQVNAIATQVAALNDQIRQATAAGQSPNEMLDQRAKLTTTLANLTGATVIDRADGSADVLVGGNPLVTGAKTHTLVLAGAMNLSDANTSTVQLEWANRPGSSAALSGGALAAAVAVLAPGTATSGGSIVSAAENYNVLATQLATQVNAIHSTGSTAAGTTNLNFFGFTAGRPAALGLTTIPTDASGIAAGTPGKGGLDGSMADTIAALGASATGPDSTWSNFVVRVGIATAKATDQAATATKAAASSSAKLLSETSVDMDEETTNLITYQHAYQGAARVMTAIDEMLDTLINRTGLVGR